MPLIPNRNPESGDPGPDPRPPETRPDVLRLIAHCKCGHPRMDHDHASGRCRVTPCNCAYFEKARPPAN